MAFGTPTRAVPARGRERRSGPLGLVDPDAGQGAIGLVDGNSFSIFFDNTAGDDHSVISDAFAGVIHGADNWQPATISCFFRSAAGQNPAASRGIWNNSTGFNSGMGFMWYGTDEVGFWVGNENTASNRSTASGLATETWYHALCVYDSGDAGQTRRLWIDGVEQNPGTSALGMGNLSTSEFEIGRKYNGSTAASNFHHGYIDEVVVWNLNHAAEVATIYNGGKAWGNTIPAAVTSGLKLRWRCGDLGGDSSPTVTDDSGNGYDGTMNGSPTLPTFDSEVP